MEQALKILQRQDACMSFKEEGCPRKCDTCKLKVSQQEMEEAVKIAEEVFEFAMQTADNIATAMIALGISSVEEWMEKFGGGTRE
jgi:hypothetical protein